MIKLRYFLSTDIIRWAILRMVPKEVTMHFW